MSLVETLSKDVQATVQEVQAKGEFNLASVIEIGSRLAVKLTQEVALKGAEKKEALLRAVEDGVSAAEAALVSAAKEESAVEAVKKVFGEIQPHIRPAVSGALDFAFAVQKGTISLAKAKEEVKKTVVSVLERVASRARSLLPSLPSLVLPQICPPKKTDASATAAPPASNPESKPSESEPTPAISIREVVPDSVPATESKTEPSLVVEVAAPQEYRGPDPSE